MTAGKDALLKGDQPIVQKKGCPEPEDSFL